LASVTVVSSSTVRSTCDDENGFLAATLVNGANSSPHALPVVRDVEAHPGPSSVLQQPVLHWGAEQSVRDGVLVEDAVVSVAPVFE
jgi:hypothetical protein